jgi:hypothetical protein
MEIKFTSIMELKKLKSNQSAPITVIFTIKWEFAMVRRLKNL